MKRKHRKSATQIKKEVRDYRRSILLEEASQDTEESEESQLYWKFFIENGECTCKRYSIIANTIF